jgi:hypothetical protein
MDGFELVAIRVDDERRVVGRSVVRTQTRRAAAWKASTAGRLGALNARWNPTAGGLTASDWKRLSLSPWPGSP